MDFWKDHLFSLDDFASTQANTLNMKQQLGQMNVKLHAQEFLLAKALVSTTNFARCIQLKMYYHCVPRNALRNYKMFMYCIMFQSFILIKVKSVTFVIWLWFCGFGMSNSFLTVTNIAKCKNASQSSTMGKSIASFAIDGQIHTVFDNVGFLCAMTAAESCYLNPWWQVDLGTEYVVHSLKIYSPGGIYSDWMRYFVVRVGNQNMDDLPTGHVWTQNPLCYEATEGVILHAAPVLLTCSAYKTITGRYVSIQKIGTTRSNNIGITLCEVEIFGYLVSQTLNVTNVAYLKPTISSTHTDTAFLAVDGYITNQTAENYQIRCTRIGGAEDVYPWWQVDLIEEHKILSITLFNSAGNNSAHLHDVSIRVGNKDIRHFDRGNIFLENALCAQMSGDFAAGPTEIQCKTVMYGRFVSVQIIEPCTTMCLEDDNNLLNLCEVQVFGHKTIPDNDLMNVALKKPCMQSSTEGKAYPGYANDGITSIDFGTAEYPRCSETSHSIKDGIPWWRVDLGCVHIVKYIVVYNRNDFEAAHLHDVRIIVGYLDADKTKIDRNSNTICAEFLNDSLPIGKSVLPCSKPMKGKYVTVELFQKCCVDACKQTLTYWAHFLSICELEVWGYPLPTKQPILYDAAWNHQILTSDDYQRETEFNEVTPNKTNGLQRTFGCPRTSDYGYDLLPWFRVDLIDEHLVKKVTIFNNVQADFRAVEIEIRVGNEDVWHYQRNVVFDNNYLCKNIPTYSFANPKVNVFCEEFAVGRYVSIQIINPCPEANCFPGVKFFLSICHVQVWGTLMMPHDHKKVRNLALNQPTEQSTLFEDGGPALAVDGDLTVKFIYNNETKCAHTEVTSHDLRPWWKVDLGQPCIIEKVVIYNIDDEVFSNSLHDVEVRIGFTDVTNIELNELFIDNDLCIEVKNRSLHAGKNELTCNPLVKGRFVTIQIVDDCKLDSCISKISSMLILCEVEVWGKPLFNFEPEVTNVALHKTTYSSSTNTVTADRSRSAVDGIKTTIFKLYGIQNCFSTKIDGRDTYPWWMVDLTDIHVIKKVIIYNQKGQEQKRAHDLEIRVGNVDVRTIPLNTIFTCNILCSSIIYHHLLPGPTVISCDKDVSGRFVTIQIVRFCKYDDCLERLKNILVLCEVEVWGYLLRKQSGKDIALRNVAVQKQVEQSSSPTPATMVLNPADGQHCAEHKERYPWWQVKLDDEKAISKLTVYFKTKNVELEHYNFEVRVGNFDVRMSFHNQIFQDNNLCGVVSDLNINLGSADVHCPMIHKGIFVTVQMTTNFSCSTVTAEERSVSVTRIAVWVQLAKKPITEKINRAIFQLTAQSSTADDRVANFAVDGNVPLQPEFILNGHQCSKTMYSKNDYYPWWRVDLKDFHRDQYNVTSVIVYQGGAFLGRFHDVEIRVGNKDICSSSNNTLFVENSVCGRVKGPILTPKVDVRCLTPLLGRFVSIQITSFCKSDVCKYHNGNVLSLCEVEVWTIEEN